MMSNLCLLLRWKI